MTPNKILNSVTNSLLKQTHSKRFPTLTTVGICSSGRLKVRSDKEICKAHEIQSIQREREVWLMAATARAALLLSRFNDLTHHKTLYLQRPPPLLSSTPTINITTTTKRNKLHHHQQQQQQPGSLVVMNCVLSGADGGGGVADDFVSTRKSNFSCEFSVIVDMLKRIEPFDTSGISNGVSSAAKEFMKRTISDILGLIPSDQYPVTIRGSRGPLHQLLTDTIITGYTLWNMEYRVSLMRNFELSIESRDGSEVLLEELRNSGGLGVPQNLGELSVEALDYIMKLKSEIASVQKELNAHKQGIVHKDSDSEGNTNLLKYLRSFERDRVNDLSQPSSLEVKEMIHQLVQNTLQRLFDDTTSGFLEDREPEKNLHDADLCETIDISRDYLANLLFWCMMLGHHLRGLENRLHLSCAVGLL